MSSLVEAEIASHLGEDKEPRPPEPPFVANLRKLDRGLARIEEVLLAACLTVLLLIGVLGAVMRNFVHVSLFWADEVIRYSVFFIGLIGAALATQSDRLFNIDMFTRLMGTRGRLVMHVLQGLFALAVCVVVFKASLVLRGVVMGEPYERIPPSVGVLSLPVTMVLMSIHFVLHIACDLYYLATRQTPPESLLPKTGH